MRSASLLRVFPAVCLLLLLAVLPCSLCSEQPTHGSQIGASISYMPVHQRGAKMRTLQAADQETGGTDIPVAGGGSWWVPDTPTDNQAMAATVSTKTQAAGGAADAAGGPPAAAVAQQEDPVSLAGVYTLPSDGAATAQAAYGNVFIAAKMSRDAVRAKSYSGKRPDMGDSSTIDATKYPDAELADMSDLAYKKVKYVRNSAQADTANTLGAPAKITPNLPPPSPTMPTISNCSGYVTKEEIIAGLEYAAGKEYMPFDPCWDARLAALQNYYGNPGSVFPFHYLNPGGYVSNVDFWLRALDDYKKGESPYILIPGPNTTSSTGAEVGVTTNANSISTVTPPATAPKTAPTKVGYGINWYGGPVVNNKNGIVIYYIWYGAWGDVTKNGTATRPTTSKVLTDMAQSIGGSSWFGTANTYYDNNGKIPNIAKYGGRAIVASKTSACFLGTSLSNDQIFQVVDCTLRKGLLPYATNAVYLLLGASNIQANSGMCTQYCGWHTYGFDSKNRQTLFGFIGSPLPCLNSCAAQGASNVLATPNYNAEADGMASIIAHEIMEVSTDPLINAWFTATGYENADLCAWTFSNNLFKAGGGLANVRWTCGSGATNAGCTSRYYLIQQNWVNLPSAGYCALAVGGNAG